MKSRSIFKKLAAFAIVLALVLSVGSVALASPGGGPKVTVIFNPNGGTLATTQIQVGVDFHNGHSYIEFDLPDGDDCTLAGHELCGWIVGGEHYRPGEEVDMRVSRVGDSYPNVIAVACWIDVEEHYILHYDITLPVTGQPADPIDETASAPITPSAVVTMPGYFFSGWTTPHWVKIAEEEQGHGPDRHIVRVYEATVYGFFCEMKVERQDEYSLLYKGYVPGVVFWPSDVVGSPTPPTIGGDPILTGYDFIGWTPYPLNWDKAVVTERTEIITPENKAPYMLITTTYTLSVEAVFQGIVPPEVPLEAPQTGDGNVLGYALLLLGLAAGLTSFVLIRRKAK
ncbi:MAG TPA: LPXTG cell wall anchor domain-containing protein [Clostridia bacterium]|nr:LPXTG cell wall anchor domain-containing protein [Clostridia bacterium]